MLAEYILLLTARRELAREMGERGRRKTVTELTWDLRYRKARGMFEGVLRGRAAP